MDVLLPVALLDRSVRGVRSSVQLEVELSPPVNRELRSAWDSHSDCGGYAPCRQLGSVVRPLLESLKEVIHLPSHADQRDLSVLLSKTLQSSKLPKVDVKDKNVGQKIDGEDHKGKGRRTFSSIGGVGPPPPSPFPKRKRASPVTSRFLLPSAPFLSSPKSH